MTHRYPTVGPRGNVKRVHRLRAEAALGRPLKGTEIVHHADGTVDRDAPLVICPDQRYHLLLHTRMKVVRRGGNPNTHRYCRRCDTCRPFAEFLVTKASGWRCRACDAVGNKVRMDRWLAGRSTT